MFFRKVNNTMNGIANDVNNFKSFADKYAEAEYIMKKEEDPLKKQKMFNRMALGILDFSDIK